MTKYTVNDVEVTEEFARGSNVLKGKMYRVDYIEESRRWWQLKPTVTVKQAYRRPFENRFRNSEDGYPLSWEASEALDNYIDCNNL